MADQLREIHRKLISANHILHHHGVVDAYGHVSARHPSDPTIYLMCGYMAPALVTSPSDLIEYHVSDSSTVDPNAKKGYSERFIHGEIFKRFPSVNCAIHSHAEDVLPYVVSGVPFKAVYHMAGFLGTHVPVFDITPHYTPQSQHDMLVNNTALGAALASHFTSAPQTSSNPSSSPSSDVPSYSVVLMRRHGFTTLAASIETAVYRAIYTKINAKVLTDSLAVSRNFSGGASGAGAGDKGVVETGLMFDSGDMALTDEQVAGCSVMNETFQEKPWRLWVREVEGRGMYVNRLN